MKALQGKHVKRMSAAIALACAVLLLTAGGASARTGTHTVSGYRGYKSIIGITVAKHWSSTTYTNTWRSDGYYHLTTPKATTNDWWTLPPTSVAGSSMGWSWYTTSAEGSGQSCIKVVFKWGVPSPWGSIGGEFTDTHLGHVFADALMSPYMTYRP